MDNITKSILNKKINGIMSGIKSTEVKDTSLVFTFTDGTTSTMSFPNVVGSDGVSVTDIQVNSNKHLLFTFSNGIVKDVGELPQQIANIDTTKIDKYIADKNLLNETDVLSLLPYVTPEQFGAVGDGVTDDTVAIKEALSKGTQIYANPLKTYNIKENIEINVNTNNLNIVSSAKITISGNYTIVLGGKLEATNGIDIISNLSNFNNIIFLSKVHISIPYQTGISSSTCGNKNNFSGCIFTNTIGDGIIIDGQAFDTKFVNCIVRYCKGLGVDIIGPGTSLVGCGVHSNYQGIHIKNGGGYISSCKIYCNGDKRTDGYGLKLDNALNWHIENTDSQQNIGGNIIIVNSKFCTVNMISTSASWEQNDKGYNGTYYGIYIDNTNNGLFGNIYYTGGIYSIGVDKGVYCKSDINIIPTSWTEFNAYSNFCTNPPTIDAIKIYGHTVPITSEFITEYDSVKKDLSTWDIQDSSGQSYVQGKLTLTRPIQMGDSLSGIVMGNIEVPDGVTTRLGSIKIRYTDGTEISSPLNSNRYGYNLVKNSSLIWHTYDFSSVIDTSKTISKIVIIIYFARISENITGEFSFKQNLALF